MDPNSLRLARSELIGRRCVVTGSPDPTMVGVEGRVADETLNTLILVRDDGRELRIAKMHNVFRFETSDGPVELEGSRLRFRPEDRIKKIR
jgi:ribonuclease P protein subunit POP4